MSWASQGGNANGPVVTPGGSGGSDGNDQVAVTSNDTTPDYLLDKLTAGANITLTELNDGGDESVQIDADPFDPDAFHDNVDGEYNALTAATPANADVLSIEDADDGFGKKKVTIADLITAVEAGLSVPLPPEHISGMDYAKTGNLVVTVQPGAARNIADTDNIVLTTTHTADLGASGAGGLDTGSVAGDTWYYLWAIGEAGTANEDVMWSLSSTEAGLTYPGSFDVARRIGVGITNTGATIIRSFTLLETVGNKRLYSWDPQESTTTTVLLNGSATIYTNVDLSDWVPPTSTLPWLECLASDDALESLWYIRPDGSSVTSSVYKGWCGASSSESGAASQQMRVRCSTSQIIEYRCNASSLDLVIVVVGFYDELSQ